MSVISFSLRQWLSQLDVDECIRTVAISHHPRQTLMHICVNHDHVIETDRPAERELVQTRTEVRVDESAVKDGETDGATDEAEVVEMLRIDVRVGRDGDGVILQRLEQAE